MSIQIWNIKTNTKVKDINDENVIEYNPDYTILVDTNQSYSVEFFVNDKFHRLENTAPFSLSGDNLNKWDYKPNLYKITAKIYSDKNKKGKLLFTINKSIRFVLPSKPAKPSAQTIPTIPATPTQQPKLNNYRNISKIVYKEQFNDDVLTMLRKHKYWVFVWGAKPTEYTSRAIMDRIKIKENKLTITCFKNDKDYSNLGLNPRAELRVNGYHLPANAPLYARIDMKLNHKDSKFEFFQIMQHNGRASPILQLEVRKGKFGVRYTNFNNGLIVVPLFNEHLDNAIWDIEFLSHTSNGYIRVYYNGKQVWELKGRTISNNVSNVWTQYGVYRNAGTDIDQSITVNEFLLAYQ
jgi:hypothetical protein